MSARMGEGMSARMSERMSALSQAHSPSIDQHGGLYSLYLWSGVCACVDVSTIPLVWPWRWGWWFDSGGLMVMMVVVMMMTMGVVIIGGDGGGEYAPYDAILK